MLFVLVDLGALKVEIHRAYITVVWRLYADGAAAEYEFFAIDLHRTVEYIRSEVCGLDDILRLTDSACGTGYFDRLQRRGSIEIGKLLDLQDHLQRVVTCSDYLHLSHAIIAYRIGSIVGTYPSVGGIIG